uniref:Queuine tRNA-ribosyltransferase catalytic subunit 1 n=1 Tax=Amphimedon queenslandica TaxID=400682 RepID=A0A1X7VA09_AMPQE
MQYTGCAMSECPLRFSIVANCSVSKARAATMSLPHAVVDTPVFMPVGTQGTMKGVTPEQLKDPLLDCRLILGNTYHLANKPGCDVLKKFDGLHNFMRWDRALLTDSGGFQMVSLLELSNVTEEGVHFQSPYNASPMLLSPEASISIQNIIGGDIIMQLDDVVHSLTVGERVEKAMKRSCRWLDRCEKAHSSETRQSLFGIVQGGLDPHLRKESIKELVKLDLPGYAIGGLSGGEKKEEFWRIVALCSDLLPSHKPRYCMGVGYPVDLIVCCALGVDMFDCVYPTRTARFGRALVSTGEINLKDKEFENDFQPIEQSCKCITCCNYTRASLHALLQGDSVVCSLLTVHNLYQHLKLMKNIRGSIIKGYFSAFVKEFLQNMFIDKKIDDWIIQSLASVNILL